MSYKGVIIEESLDNTAVLSKVKIIKTKNTPRQTPKKNLQGVQYTK